MSHTKKILLETLKTWAPIAIVTIVFTFTIYATVQQNYRQSANDPLLQVSEQVTDMFNQGAPANQIVPEKGMVDIAKSISPFVQIYDTAGTLIGSSIILDGNNPQFPKDVLDKVKDQINTTWEPKHDVRLATIVTKYKDGENKDVVIVAGRSLKAVDDRSMQTLYISLIAGAFILILTFLVIWLFKKIEHPKTVSEHTPTTY